MRTRAAGVTLAVALLTVGASAQQRAKGGVPELLQRSDSAARGREVVASVYTWEPNTHTGWHTHPGEMIGHVTEGQIVLEHEGKTAATFSAGQTFVVPSGVPHNCINEGSSKARVFVTYLVEKGKPITAPLQGRR